MLITIIFLFKFLTTIMLMYFHFNWLGYLIYVYN